MTTVGGGGAVPLPPPSNSDPSDPSNATSDLSNLTPAEAQQAVAGKAGANQVTDQLLSDLQILVTASTNLAKDMQNIVQFMAADDPNLPQPTFTDLSKNLKGQAVKNIAANINAGRGAINPKGTGGQAPPTTVPQGTVRAMAAGINARAGNAQGNANGTGDDNTGLQDNAAATGGAAAAGKAVGGGTANPWFNASPMVAFAIAFQAFAMAVTKMELTQADLSAIAIGMQTSLAKQDDQTVEDSANKQAAMDINAAICAGVSAGISALGALAGFRAGQTLSGEKLSNMSQVIQSATQALNSAVQVVQNVNSASLTIQKGMLDGQKVELDALLSLAQKRGSDADSATSQLRDLFNQIVQAWTQMAQANIQAHNWSGLH